MRLLFLILIFFLSCKTARVNNINRQYSCLTTRGSVEHCQGLWKYSDLLVNCKVNVLYYFPKYTILNQDTILAGPCWLVGVDKNADTFVVVDINYVGEIKKNDKIHVKPKVWSDSLKTDAQLFITGFVFQEDKLQRLMCSVKHAYFGEFLP